MIEAELGRIASALEIIAGIMAGEINEKITIKTPRKKAKAAPELEPSFIDETPAPVDTGLPPGISEAPAAPAVDAPPSILDPLSDANDAEVLTADALRDLGKKIGQKVGTNGLQGFVDYVRNDICAPCGVDKLLKLAPAQLPWAKKKLLDYAATMKINV